MAPTEPQPHASEAGSHASSIQTSELIPNGKIHQTISISDTKLYGREAEESALLDVYGRVCRPQDSSGNSRRQPEFVCISGAAGEGKTTLANTLRRHVTMDGGFFLSGKFDLMERNEIYAPFVAAFTEFASLVASRGDDDVARVREDIQTAVGVEGAILTDMIPALKDILGDAKEDSVSELRPKTNRFSFVFRMFLRAVCSPERPIVVVIDDLQWADQASLELLQSLIPDPQHEGLLFVGSWDIDEKSTKMESFVRRLRDSYMVETIQIRVGPVEASDIYYMLTETLCSKQDNIVRLAELMHGLSGGNMLYVIELLQMWHDAGALGRDSHATRWEWDEDEIQAVSEHDSVEGLIGERILTLPPPVQETLKVAACLGAEVDGTFLQTALSGPVPIVDYLALAVSQRFLTALGGQDRYRFTHDVIQATAYSLIPEDLKTTFHFTIGRKLSKKLDSFVVDQNLFCILDQLYRGSPLIESPTEKNAIALLCLDAGSRAILSSSFHSASSLFDFGLSLLGDSAWKGNYNLTLALYSAAAEVAYCIGNIDRVNDLTSVVIENARCFRDKLRAYSTDIHVLGARDKMHQSIDLGLTILAHLGVSLPAAPSGRYLTSEFRRVRRLLKGKSNEMILRIYPMVDEDKVSAMQILNLIFVSTYMSRPYLCAVVTLRMVRLTLEFGLTAISSAAFAFYGILVCSSAGDPNDGFRFGQLALALLDQFKTREWIPRVYAAVYGCIYPWSRRLDQTLEPLRQAIQVGLETGDVEFSMLNAAIFCFTAVDCGGSLACIEKEATAFVETMVLQRQEGILVMLKPFLQMVENFRREVEDPTRLTGTILDESKALDHAHETNNHMSVHAINFQKSTLAYVFGDYKNASKSIAQCREVFQHPMANFEVTSLAFFDGLITLALALEATTSMREKNNNIVHARLCIKRLKRWALMSPVNCLGKLSLLQAEEAAVVGKLKRAYMKYVAAIAISVHAGFTYEGAIANERAARFLFARGKEDLGLQYMKESRNLYEQWGAHAKARLLEAEIFYTSG